MHEFQEKEICPYKIKIDAKLIDIILFILKMCDFEY